MKDTNNGTLVCRLTKDSELTYMQSGSAKLDFSVAFTTTRKNGNEWVDETNYLNNLNLWGKQAESLSNYLKKGVMVCVSYHLKMDSWEKDGKRMSLLKTVVDDIQLLSRPQGVATKQNETAPAPVEQQGEFPEDIPF